MLNKHFMGKVIQCHIDHSDPESFVVGRLVHSDSNWFLMEDISPAGHWNGLALYMKSDVVLVNENTDYIRRILLLMKYRDEPEPTIPLISDDPLISLLLFARDSARIIGLELYASGYRDINGIVESLTRTTLCIKQIDEFGHVDGKSYLSISAITRFYMDDEESTCLEILFESNKYCGGR